MISRRVICGKASIFVYLLLITILTMSFGIANGADNLQKQALDQASKEIDKYVAHCSDSWYASDYYFQPFVEMKHRNAPSMNVYELSEADKLNGVEWSGTFVYTFHTIRRGHVKSGALNWQQWSNSEERFTVNALRSNGQWQVSVATSPGGDSWVQHNKWLSSCADLTGNTSVGNAKQLTQLSKDQILNLANIHKCFTCHDIDKKVVGPAWRDVAARYRGMDWAVDQLVDKVSRGGAGAWGTLPEVPHPEMSQTDIRVLVQFILAL